MEITDLKQNGSVGADHGVGTDEGEVVKGIAESGEEEPPRR
jgi:hypothetical protein